MAADAKSSGCVLQWRAENLQDGTMYRPAPFDEPRREVMISAMAQHPLAALVTIGTDGHTASHIPLLYYPAHGTTGILRGHIARANPQWQEHVSSTEALAIFSGPQHYISPAWYPSKQQHGKVVPTWNYVVVHARGTLSFKHDPDWLLENVRALSNAQEQSSETPWKVEDAPPEFIANLLNAIVGVEMAITRLEGKWKVSQNRSIPDRLGVVAGLEKAETSESLEMARLVKAYLPPRS
jgi:transcriptional regulator